MQVDGWVISTRGSGGRKGSYYATVEYYVNSERCQKEFSCDYKTKVGERMKLCYSPDHPEGAKEKMEYVPICAIFCLFQLWLMARAGFPTIFSACSRKKYVLPVAEGPEKSGTTTPGMAGGTERVKNLPPQGKGIIAPTTPK